MMEPYQPHRHHAEAAGEDNRLQQDRDRDKVTRFIFIFPIFRKRKKVMWVTN